VAKRWSDEQKPHMRRTRRTRGPRDSWERFKQAVREQLVFPYPRIVHSIYRAKPCVEEPGARIGFARVRGSAVGQPAALVRLRRHRCSGVEVPVRSKSTDL